jgi:hypothetical protein
VIGVTNPKGTLIEAFEGGRNAWMTQEEYGAQELTFEGTSDGFKDPDVLPHITVVEAKHEYDPKVY